MINDATSYMRYIDPDDEALLAAEFDAIFANDEEDNYVDEYFPQPIASDDLLVSEFDGDDDEEKHPLQNVLNDIPLLLRQQRQQQPTPKLEREKSDINTQLHDTTSLSSAGSVRVPSTFMERDDSPTGNPTKSSPPTVLVGWAADDIINGGRQPVLVILDETDGSSQHSVEDCIHESGGPQQLQWCENALVSFPIDLAEYAYVPVLESQRFHCSSGGGHTQMYHVLRRWRKEHACSLNDEPDYDDVVDFYKTSHDQQEDNDNDSCDSWDEDSLENSTATEFGTEQNDRRIVFQKTQSVVAIQVQLWNRILTTESDGNTFAASPGNKLFSIQARSSAKSDLSCYSGDDCHRQDVIYDQGTDTLNVILPLASRTTSLREMSANVDHL